MVVGGKWVFFVESVIGSQKHQKVVKNSISHARSHRRRRLSFQGHLIASSFYYFASFIL